MKTFLTILAFVSVTAQVHAAEAVAGADEFCRTLMPCGTYEGTGANYANDGTKKPGSDYVEVITITATGPRSAVVTDKMASVDKPDELFYDLEVDFEFDADGAYKVRDSDGSLFASGVCKELLCTFNFVPFINKLGKVTANVNYLRFENGKLLRQMMSSQEYGQWNMQRTEFVKK